MHHVGEGNDFTIRQVSDSVTRVDKQDNHVHLIRDLDHSLFKIIQGFLELIEALVESLSLIFREF